ncbi:MAG: hypothetical protein ACHQ4G_00610 [Opitutales bacterium]
MKRLVLPLLAVFVLALAVNPAGAATNDRSSTRSPGAGVATAVSTVTGIAISPLLGTSAYGAYQYVTAKDAAARTALPWYAQMSFWLPALVLVALVAAKDSFGAVIPPGLKKPFDVLEVMENKVSGLVAAGAVVPFTMNSVSKLIASHTAPAAHHTYAASGLAMLHFGMIDFSWALDILTVPFGIAMFAVVWMASHAINVLILLSPWGAIDAALKALRTALLGLLTLTATINPWVGALLSVGVIIGAYLVAGWAFRLTVFGTIFSWDFFTVRRARFTPAENDNAMFAGGNLPGVPVRTYGRLVLRSAGNYEFVYRPWLWLSPKVASVPVTKEKLAVGKGLFFSTITAENIGTLFLLPPRYRGHEDVLARAYLMGGGVRDAGLRKAWSLLKELFSGRAAKTQVG